MYLRIEDFITDWESEEAFTLKIFSKITEEIKGNKTNENVRTLERLAWHITRTLTEMPFRAGILKEDVLDGLEMPGRFVEIIETYKKYSNEMVSSIQDKWTDADLVNNVDIYGQEWEKRKILSILVKHQIHHRGQMTTLMRLNNLAVPGTYGPSKEEWSELGMDAHE